MENNLLSHRHAPLDALRPPPGAMASVGTKMLTHLPPRSPFRHAAPVPDESAGTMPETIAYPDDFATMVVKLLDDARLALGSDREAAKASIVRASAMLRDGTNQGTKDGVRTTSRGGLAQWQIRRATTHIDACLMSKVTVEDLSKITRLSKSHFSRAFRVSMGEPVHGYIIQRRIERARELMLTTDQPLCQIALACGLSDQAHLSRLFRRVVGASPNVWRRQWRCDGPINAKPSHRSLAITERQSGALSAPL